MPTYLCHGFRWHRKSIRYMIILQDIEDGAPEWIVAPKSAVAILDSFYQQFDFLPPCFRPGSRRERRPIGLSRSGSVASRNASPKSSNGQSTVSTISEEERVGRRSEDRKSRSRDASGKRSRSTSRLRKAPDWRQEAATMPLPPPAPPPAGPPPPIPAPVVNVPFNDWSAVKLVEEYDPRDESSVSRPWAYVADYVVRVDDSVSPMEEMLQYEERMKEEMVKPMSGPSDETGRRISTVGNKKAGWLEKLRDRIQQDESIRWYVVVCGDEERAVPQEDKYEKGPDSGVSLGDSERSSPQEEKPRDFGQAEFEYRLARFTAFDRNSMVVQPLRLRRPSEPLIRSQPRPAETRLPVTPPKDAYAAPPDPLQNLQEVARRATMLPLRPRPQRSVTGLRRLFFRKQVDTS